MVEVEPENMQLNVPNSQKWAFLWETTNFSKGTIMILLLLHVLVCWFTHTVGLLVYMCLNLPDSTMLWIPLLYLNF